MLMVDVDEDGGPVSAYRPGDALPGGVRAIERLGVGHRCETWLAWSPQRWCAVVAKFPRPHQVEHPRARRSLGREVLALADNPHPGLPILYVDGTDDAVPYLLFDYVDGPTLDDEIADRGAFAPGDAVLLGAQLAAALHAVHVRGLAHVDIKPENVLLRAGRPVLLDFGSARAIGATQPRGRLIGSPGYAAPDLESGAPISAAMDVYGLGVTLYEALTGTEAFDPDLLAADRRALEPLPPSPVADLVHAMIAGDPAARPDLDEVLVSLWSMSESDVQPYLA